MGLISNWTCSNYLLRISFLRPNDEQIVYTVLGNIKEQVDLTPSEKLHLDKIYSLTRLSAKVTPETLRNRLTRIEFADESVNSGVTHNLLLDCFQIRHFQMQSRRTTQKQIREFSYEILWIYDTSVAAAFCN